MEPVQIKEVKRLWKSAPFLGISPHTHPKVLCTLSSHPSYKEHSQTVRPRIRNKTKDIQLEVDEQFIASYPLDSIYRVYVFFPTGKTSPFLDRVRLEELYSWTIPV